MLYRVTQNHISATARNYVAKQTSELYTVQQQISSGLKIQRPADDPAGMRRSLIQKDRLERLETHEVGINNVRSRLEQAHVQLRDASTVLTRVREISLQAAQVTDESESTALASELDGLLNQMISIANSTDESGYLFSGTATNTRPFPGALDANGQFVYAGTSQSTQLHIAGDVDRHALLGGDTVFRSVQRQPVVVIGNTGAKAGTGTDTASGTRNLTISHTLTTFSAGSGVQAGTSSTGGDTVIGPQGAHSLQIVDTSGTGAFGTVSLNGATPTAFASTDTDLMVTGPRGEKVYLQMSSITPGFNGSVDITAAGAMSIDGGASTTPLTFQPNEQVTDSRDGSVVNLNTTAIRGSGEDQLEFPGTSDVFNVMKGLRDDLLNTRGLESSARYEAFNRRVGDVEQIQNHILDVVGVQSVSLEQIQRLENRTGDLKLAEKLEYGNTVSADITDAVVRLQELTNLQQFTMSAVGQLLTPNLLNYIQ